SPFDPYIGLGFGYIHTDLKNGDEFNRKSALLSTLTVSSADEGEYNINTRCRRENGSGCTQFKPGPPEANVKDAWEWHAVGGVDYYMSDRVSLYVDARYVWSSGAIDIRTDDAHQVQFAVLDEGQIFLKSIGKDGKAFNPNDPSTWLLWEDQGVVA